MSLTITRPFTISTYDPPSTPIAIAAQQSGQNPSRGGTRGELGPSIRKSTPSDTDNVWGNLRRTEATPPVRNKILPWVHDIVTEGYMPPEGMFGPYDSRPPTRYQSPEEKRLSAPGRNFHPYALNAQQSASPSGLASEVNLVTAIAEDIATRPRPESDILSRGVESQYLFRTKERHETGADTPPGARSSPGMGTFGIEASQDPLSSSEVLLPQVPPKSPNKSPHKIPRKPPLSNSLTTPKASQRAIPDIDEENHFGPNVKIHHEHPFSREEASRIEDEAMAQFEALQRLIGAAGGVHVSTSGGVKGPRETYDTTTSGPSFGHLHHRNGMPISRHISYQQELGAPSFMGNAMFHIPFGANVGIPLPRAPLMFGGLPLPGSLPAAIGRDAPHSTDSPEHRQKRSDRSAFVESVTDEQDPTIRQDKSRAAPLVDHTVDPVESNITGEQQLDRESVRSKMATGQKEIRPPDAPSASKHLTSRQYDPESSARTNQSPHHPSANAQRDSKTAHIKTAAETGPGGRQLTREDIETDLFHALEPMYGPTIARQVAMNHSVQSQQPPGRLLSPAILRAPDTGIPSMTSQIPTQGSLTPVGPEEGRGSRMPSMTSNMTVKGSPNPRPQDLEPEQIMSPYTASSVSTTPSNVKHIVAESKFHDETLCQLLDAARLNLIGEEAKKALNRAARARVIELRDMRAHGEIGDSGHIPLPRTPPRTPPRKDKKDKEKRSRSRERRAKRASDPSDVPPLSGREEPSRPSSGHQPAAGASQPSTPPEWAQDILKRLTMFDARLSQLDRDSMHLPGHGHMQEPSQDIPSDFLNDLIFNTDMPATGMTPGGLHGLPIPLGFDPFSFAFGTPPDRSFTPKGGAYLRTISSNGRESQESKAKGASGGVMSWGSEVELPADDTKVSPPSNPNYTGGGGKTSPPAIHVQPPTESYMGKSLKYATTSQAETVRTGKTSHSPPAPQISGKAQLSGRGEVPPPRRTDIRVIEEQLVDLHDPAMPDPAERDLPPPPSESIRSHRPSSSATPTPARYTGFEQGGNSPISLREALGPSAPSVQPIKMPTTRSPQPTVVNYARMMMMMKPTMSSAPESTNTAYKTASQSLPPDTPPRTTKDKITVVDTVTTAVDPNPWDLVTQRLYSWAVVWEEDSFNRAMEEISLGKQVGEFALTIFMVMTFKRLLRRSLTETPQRVCDKLFVPPTFAEAINQAVHAQQYKAAQQMLEELWYPFLFKDPPRVIIALTRDPKNHDTWLAHRFDLGSAHLRSYKFCSEESEVDGRPFRWWYAIRLAWPQYKIPDPDDLMIQTTSTFSPPELKHQNSLAALNCARNLFLGFRPEHEANLNKLRESVWGEVKRLREKKRNGKLISDMDVTSKDTS